VVKGVVSMFFPWDSQIAREIEKNLLRKRAVQLTSVASISRLVDKGKVEKGKGESDDPFA
jgi:hypothetical protein